MKLQRRQIVGILAVIVGVVLLVILVASIGGSGEDGNGGIAGLTTEQKNAQRKVDLQKLLDKSNEYRAEHGSLPSDLAGWQSLMQEYLPDFKSPDGQAYKLVQACDYNTQYCVMPDALGWEQNKDQIYVAWHAACASGALAGYTDDNSVVAYTALQDARPVCVGK